MLHIRIGTLILTVWRNIIPLEMYFIGALLDLMAPYLLVHPVLKFLFALGSGWATHVGQSQTLLGIQFV